MRSWKKASLFRRKSVLMRKAANHEGCIRRAYATHFENAHTQFCLCHFSIFTVFNIAGTVFLIVDFLLGGMREGKYAPIAFFLAFLFGAWTFHDGAISVSVCGDRLVWKKEKFVEKRAATLLQRLLYGVENGTVSTIVRESFAVSRIKSYGLFEDYDDIKIEEKMRYTMIPQQILVFVLSDGEVFYIHVRRFTKRQVRKLLRFIEDETQIAPKSICQKVFHMQKAA